MYISLRRIIRNLTLPDMIFLKSKWDFFEIEEIDIYKLNLYKDYIVLPYIEEAVIYDAFLDSKHLTKEKEMLHKNDDFEVCFRRYIDSNKKYGHLLFEHYIQFEIDYLKPIAIEWCNRYKIKYDEDI